MALPLPNSAEDEDEDALEHGSDTAGYAVLPSGHLSDSSDNSNDASSNFAYDTVSTMPDRNDGQRDGTSYQNGSFSEHIDGIENEASIEAITHGSSNQNGHHVASADVMGKQGAARNRNVLHIDGMEIHDYGQLARLQISSPIENDLHSYNPEVIDDEDDVDEMERQRAEDAAFQRAKEADEARRLAPLPPDRCQAIKKAMQSVSLGGFQPEWANKVPEEQWVNKLRRKLKSHSTED